MSQTFYTLLTQIGAAEWANAQVANISLPITHLAVGDGNGNPVVPVEGMVALTNEVHRVAISSVAADVENPNWLIFEAVLPAAIGGWTIREIGLIGGTGAGNKLLAIGNFPASYKPVLTEGAAKDLVIRMIVEVSNASIVTLTINPAVVVATVQAINNAVAAHAAAPGAHANYVRHDAAQALSSGAKTQARTNIGAAGTDDVSGQISAAIKAARPARYYFGQI